MKWQRTRPTHAADQINPLNWEGHDEVSPIHQLDLEGELGLRRVRGHGAAGHSSNSVPSGLASSTVKRYIPTPSPATCTTLRTDRLHTCPLMVQAPRTGRHDQPGRSDGLLIDQDIVAAAI